MKLSYLIAAAGIRLLSLALGIGVLTATASAEEATPAKAANTPEPPAYAELGDESQQYAVEAVASGLDNPCGLALRPGTATAGGVELYFSESGAGRVVRVTAEKPDELLPVITNFPVGALKRQQEYRVGPLALEFITSKKLAVATGGLGEGQDLIRVYVLPADAAPLDYEKADHSVGPIPASERSARGEGQFFSMTKIEDAVEKAIYVTSSGDENQGWVLKASVRGNRLSDLQPFVATRRTTGVARPMAGTVNPTPRRHYLVVGQSGEVGSERDSVIAFYGPVTGAAAPPLRTGLFDIVDLEYGPTGDLYAVDASWADAKAGGVYRIDAATVDGRETCRAVKIAAIERPTSLAFAPDGALYVTAFGDRTDSEQQPTGKLVKVTPQEPTAKL